MEKENDDAIVTVIAIGLIVFMILVGLIINSRSTLQEDTVLDRIERQEQTDRYVDCVVDIDPFETTTEQVRSEIAQCRRLYLE